MEIKTESVTTVYKNGVAVALIKRDDVSKKNLVYTVREATVQNIAGLISNDVTNED